MRTTRLRPRTVALCGLGLLLATGCKPKLEVVTMDPIPVLRTAVESLGAAPRLPLTAKLPPRSEPREVRVTSWMDVDGVEYIDSVRYRCRASGSGASLVLEATLIEATGGDADEATQAAYKSLRGLTVKTSMTERFQVLWEKAEAPSRLLSGGRFLTHRADLESVTEHLRYGGAVPDVPMGVGGTYSNSYVETDIDGLLVGDCVDRYTITAREGDLVTEQSRTVCQMSGRLEGVALEEGSVTTGESVGTLRLDDPCGEEATARYEVKLVVGGQTVGFAADYRLETLN